MKEAEKKLTTTVASCRTEVIVHSPPAWIIINHKVVVLWKSKLIKQVVCIVKEKGERMVTELGFKRERQRGQRGDPRPGFMVGSWWYILPLLSFSSYTSLVPILFLLFPTARAQTHRCSVSLFSFIKPFKTLCLTIIIIFWPFAFWVPLPLLKIGENILHSFFFLLKRWEMWLT